MLKNLMKILPILGVMAFPFVLSQGEKTAFADTSPSQVTVTSYSLNVREEGDVSSKLIGLVHQGDTFEIIQTKNNWDQIKLSSGKTGWVSSAYVTPTVNKNASVDVNVLNVRMQPNSSSRVIDKLPFETNLTIQAEVNGWAKITSSSGIQGWVNEKYIQKEVTSGHLSSAAIPAQNINQSQKVASSDQLSQMTSLPKQEMNIQQTTPSLMQKSMLPLTGKTIVLDPGHGGNDDGATSIVGTPEKTLTLETAKVVQKKLENAGANVIMTRTDDTYVPLPQRAAVANQNQADAFISFHYNWSNEPSVSGLTDFYYHNSKDNVLAVDILNEIVKSTKLNFIGTRFDDLSVLRNNLQPCTLIELGFISNKQEDSIVESSVYRDNVAQGVYQGLLDYFFDKNQ